MSNDTIKITSPYNGDILNRHDGAETDDALTVEVTGSAPAGAEVSVNGHAALVDGAAFTCSVPVRYRVTEITATAKRQGRETSDRVTVLWDKASRPRFRFSLDDNIQFLKDLGTAPQDYASLFDHWYLGFWRRMHREFGAKIHINIYYQTVEHDFNITQMPDKWKDEWAANGDWLHLSFHALQDKPDRIYKDATYDQIARDYDLVMGEIKRFASEAVVSPVTTVHWAEAPKDACRALHDRGIRGLIGIFYNRSGRPVTTGYYLDEETARHVAGRDYWFDTETDLIFIECDQVVNGFQVAEIAPWLDQRGSNPHTGELIELLIHEQYFRQDLPRHYQPDVQDKVIAALTWVAERGYEPVFWGDGFVGNSVELA